MSNWNEFNEDCIRHYGKILNGEFKHFCGDFDYLPIDETCFEFRFCLCDYVDWDTKKKRSIIKELEKNNEQE